MTAGNRVVVGIDVGGSSTVAAIHNGHMRASHEVATNTSTEQALTSQLCDLVEMLVAGDGLGGPIDAIGVGIPGQTDPDAGTVRHAVNLGIGSLDLPLASILGDRFGVPVRVENDVRVAALGAFEHLCTDRPDLDSLVYLGVGTGISAGAVLDGRIHRGSRGLAGEIGHLPLDPGGPACSCGLVGCLEALAAGPAISRRWPEGAGALFEAGARGTAGAGAIAEQIAGHLAHAVHLLAATYDPDVVVLGGGVGSSGDATLDAVRAAMRRRAAQSEFAGIVLDPERVITLPAGLDIGARGAVRLAIDAITLQDPAQTGRTDGGRKQ